MKPSAFGQGPVVSRSRRGRGSGRIRLPGWLKEAIQATGGATLIEFAFILPVLLAILTGILQFGGLFFLQSSMAQVARETARALVVGEINQSGAKSFAEARLINWGITYSVGVTAPNPPTANDYVVVISAPMAEASLVDIFGLFQSGTLQARASMRE